MIRQINNIPVRPQYIPFEGGMDTVTPQIVVNPGTARSAQNVYGDIDSGYKTAIRYERYDGQDQPSDAIYSILTVDITGSVSVGDVLTDATAAAYGTVLLISSTSVVLTKITGLFATGDIKVGAGVVGTCVGPQTQGTAETPQLGAQYTNIAADSYRADITAVPGSGIGRGVVEFNDITYAFRDNVGATECDVYKSSGSGWTQVPLGFELAFTSGGTHEPQEGDEIEGETSGATATLTRIVVESGSFSGGDAAGRFIFTTQSGTFQSETVKIVAGGPYLNVATIAGDSDAITLDPGGKYEFIIANFTGSSSTRRMYGCDGVNKGFEFDGTVFVQISTGIGTDTPTHVAEYQNRLVFAYGPAAEFSTIADPYQWSPLLGSAVITIGSDVTGFQLQQGQQDTGALAIFGRNSTHMLYNNGSGTISDWQLISYKSDTGAVEWTNQRIGATFFLDDKGIVDLRAAQEFGNFRDSVVSDQIKTWFKAKKTQVTHSCTFKEKNLYCIYFADKTAIYATVINGKVKALMPQLFSHKVERIFSTEDTNGDESVTFIDDSGYVYKMDKGTSFDGDNVEWWFYTAYSHMGSPYVNKRFRRAVMEVIGSGYADFYLSYSLDYGSSDKAQPVEMLETVNLNSYNWDSFVWDLFTWDASSLSPSDMSIKSKGENISLMFRGSSDYQAQIRFSGAIVQYNNIKRVR